MSTPCSSFLFSRWWKISFLFAWLEPLFFYLLLFLNFFGVALDSDPAPQLPLLFTKRMNTLQLNVTAREATGRSSARKVRGEDRIPAVIYGLGDSRLCSINRKEFERLRKDALGNASLVELQEEGGATALTLIKEVQRHAISRQFLHVDFQEVDKDREFTTTIPIVLIGESIGVKQNDGILQHQTLEVSVKCKPADLPSQYEVDTSELDLGDSVSVKDLALASGVTILNDPNQSIVTCSGSAQGRADADLAEVDEGAGEEGAEAGDEPAGES
jgi:large subunit ribosomal protein L25